MNWNEAYALWKSIQVGQLRNEDYLKGIAFQQDQWRQQTQAMGLKGQIAALITRGIVMARGFMLALGQRMGAAFGATVQVARQAAQFVRQLGQVVMQGLQQGLQGMVDITDKLAIILGDFKKLAEDVLHHNLEVFKALLRRFAPLAALGQIQQMVSKVFRQFLPGRLFRAAERRVRSLFRTLRGWFGRKSPEQDPAA